MRTNVLKLTVYVIGLTAVWAGGWCAWYREQESAAIRAAARGMLEMDAIRRGVDDAN